MDKAFREISFQSGVPPTQDQVDKIFRELLRAPIARVGQEMQHLKRNLFIDASLVVGSLATTFIAHGNTMVTAAAILAGSMAAGRYKESKDKEDVIKQLPGFFFWDITHESRGRHDKRKR